MEMNGGGAVSPYSRLPTYPKLPEGLCGGCHLRSSPASSCSSSNHSLLFQVRGFSFAEEGPSFGTSHDGSWLSGFTGGRMRRAACKEEQENCVSNHASSNPDPCLGMRDTKDDKKLYNRVKRKCKLFPNLLLTLWI